MEYKIVATDNNLSQTISREAVETVEGKYYCIVLDLKTAFGPHSYLEGFIRDDSWKKYSKQIPALELIVKDIIDNGIINNYLLNQ